MNTYKLKFEMSMRDVISYSTKLIEGKKLSLKYHSTICQLQKLYTF